MPDNESSAKIDIAGITEALRQWLKELDVEVERIKTDPRAEIDTATIRQSIKDLDAETERINASCEALPPPIDRAAASIRLKPHRRAVESFSRRAREERG